VCLGTGGVTGTVFAPHVFRPRGVTCSGVSLCVTVGVRLAITNYRPQKGPSLFGPWPYAERISAVGSQGQRRSFRTWSCRTTRSQSRCRSTTGTWVRLRGLSHSGSNLCPVYTWSKTSGVEYGFGNDGLQRCTPLCIDFEGIFFFLAEATSSDPSQSLVVAQGMHELSSFSLVQSLEPSLSTPDKRQG